MDLFASTPRATRTFRDLYSRHFALVWSVVCVSGVPMAAREDVVQEVWVRVHQILPRLRADASERAWLVAVARGRILHHHRSRYRRERREAAAAAASLDQHRGDHDRIEAKSLVGRVLASMPDEQRLAFVLVHGLGLTGPEAATALSAPVNTLYSRLRLARAHVQRVAKATRLEESRIAGHVAPPREAKTRTWLAVCGGLPPPAAATLSTWASLTAFAATVAVGVAAVAVTHAMTGPAASASSSKDAGSVALPRAADPKPVVVPTSPPVTPSATAGAPLPTPAVTPSPPASTRRAKRRPSRAATATDAPRLDERDETTPGPSRAAAASDADSLAAEAQLLKRAKRALNRGQAPQALALLDEHARTFPNAALSDVRRGVRVRALCALGRTPEARAEAKRLGDASIVARGIADTCGRPGAG